MTTPENQATICEWANATFGPPTSVFRALARSNEEMAELVKLASTGTATAAGIIEEAADVAITLCQVAPFVGEDLSDAMRIAVPATVPASVSAASANAMLAHVLQDCAEGRPNGIGIYLSLVVIRLAQMCAKLDAPLCLAVDAKMLVNRSRAWNIDGTGHGYHVEQGAPDANAL